MYTEIFSSDVSKSSLSLHHQVVVELASPGGRHTWQGIPLWTCHMGQRGSVDGNDNDLGFGGVHILGIGRVMSNSCQIM